MTAMHNNDDTKSTEVQASTSRRRSSKNAPTAQLKHEESLGRVHFSQPFCKWSLADEGVDKENKSTDHEEANDDSSSGAGKSVKFVYFETLQMAFQVGWIMNHPSTNDSTGAV